MLPTNYHILDKAIKEATRRDQLVAVFRQIEEDRFLTAIDKQRLKHDLYKKIRITY